MFDCCCFVYQDSDLVFIDVHLSIKIVIYCSSYAVLVFQDYNFVLNGCCFGNRKKMISFFYLSMFLPNLWIIV